MSETEVWLIEWFATRKGFDKGTPLERLAVDYFQAKLLDSFGVMELITDIEMRFAVRFADHHFQDRRFSIIGGLARIVSEFNQGQEMVA